MSTRKLQTTVTAEGSIVIEGLSEPPGTAVEVTISTLSTPKRKFQFSMANAIDTTKWDPFAPAEDPDAWKRFVILLDTHVWIWIAQKSPRIPDTYLRALELEEDELAISAISVWEVGLLVKKGRIDLTVTIDQWIESTSRELDLNVVPLNQGIALEAIRLPEPLHRDPADRMIVATARHNNARLATFDEAICEYPFVSIYKPTSVM